jgi:multidrug resistance efflux pump
MASEPAISTDSPASACAELSNLQRWHGPPTEFWPRYLKALGTLTGAAKIILLRKDAGTQPQWKKLAEVVFPEAPTRFLPTFTIQSPDIAERCSRNANLVFPLEEGNKASPWVIGVRLNLHPARDLCIATLLLPTTNETLAREVLLRLLLAADIPAAYQSHQVCLQAKADVEKLAFALDLMVQVNAEKRFLAAALAFCNGLATHFTCDRVSLGWLHGGFIKLRAISRMERFDRQMLAAKALEITMEEALDQNEEIVVPRPEGATVITRDHEEFLQTQHAGHLCSLPLRADNQPVAVVTCERLSRPFDSLELQQLRLCADQATRRLADLQRRDRWLGARVTLAAKEKMAKLVGPEHTWAKVLTVTVTLLLATLFFVRVNYRIEGNFILRSDEVAYLTAPFDGYIDQAPVRPGDPVAARETLLTLNTNDLVLEEASALADLVRFQREAEKARATNALAEMRIAQALADQAKARLDLVQYRLGQAIITAPFDGVVVEGDLRERLGAPVKQGEPLFKIARTQSLYVQADIQERDIHELRENAKGMIAFVSQPRLKFPVRVERIEPAALPKNRQNVFQVRCAFTEDAQTWWRPGMSGVCKLEVGKRTLFWIITHRTVDFLRLKLWWP